MNLQSELAACKVLCRAVCKECDCPELADQITFEFSDRMTSTNGRAFYVRKHIKLSSFLFKLHTPEIRDATIVHEVCHIVTWYKHKYAGHGSWWRHYMLKCGYKPERCAPEPANYSAALAQKRPSAARKKVHCNCPNGQLIGPVQYKRLLAGREYRCQICMQKVYP